MTKATLVRIPAKAGISWFFVDLLNSGIRRNDDTHLRCFKESVHLKAAHPMFAPACRDSDRLQSLAGSFSSGNYAMICRVFCRQTE